MNNIEKFTIPDLPKWPGMLVKGKKITVEQAYEVILRTTDFNWSSNDFNFEEHLNEYLYGYTGIKGWDSYRVIEQEKDKIAFINQIDNIYYLKNSRILSSWVGGAKGWCNWDGEIYCGNYNIGKWPSVSEVFNEWALIASAFPFLELTCQILNNEILCDEKYRSEPEIKAVVQFNIINGAVHICEPDTDMLHLQQEIDYTNRFSATGERGCTFQQFKTAIDYMREKYVEK